MISKNHALMIEAIFKLRAWCRQNLPIENSLIAYDLILLLSIHHYSNGHITVKQLFASIPHSYTAVRIHYQRFLDEGWIEHYPDPSDKRIKYVRPTQKFIEMINRYAEAANDIFKIEGLGSNQ
jgi:DNA-binding MarR family transcriptional regulator